jgi:hypothetical protein
MLELAAANHPRIEVPPDCATFIRLPSANKRLNCKLGSFLIFQGHAETYRFESALATSSHASFSPFYPIENKSHNQKSVSFLIFTNSAAPCPRTATDTPPSNHPANASQNLHKPLHCHKGSYKIPLSRVEPLPFGMTPGTEMTAAEKLVRARYKTSSGPESVR